MRAQLTPGAAVPAGWYDRAGVERVSGWCSDAEYELFIDEVKTFERSLTDAGIIVVKYWLEVSEKEQERRYIDRMKHPWKRFVSNVRARPEALRLRPEEPGAARTHSRRGPMGRLRLSLGSQLLPCPPGAAAHVPQADFASYSKWYAFSRARDEMLRRTDSKWAPWLVLNSEDRKVRERRHGAAASTAGTPSPVLPCRRLSCPCAAQSHSRRLRRARRLPD